MSVYPVLRLGDVADVVAGDPAPQDPKAFASDGPLFVRMQDVGRHHRHSALSESTDRLSSEWVKRNHLRLFPKDSILIPKSGASVNLNHRAKLATDAHVVSHLAIVIPDRTKIEPDYLYWWSANYDPRAQVQVTSLPSLKLSTLKSALVPLPPLEEQRRIVGILNRAARVERLQKQAHEQLRKFIPALFVKMFGDPINNPMGWTKQELGQVCIHTEQRDPRIEPTKEFRYVDISGIDNHSKRINTVRRIRGAAAPSRARKVIRRNDVLVSCVRPNLNAVAIVPEGLDGEIASTGFCVLRANRSSVDPVYLFLYVTTSHFIDIIVSKARGANYPAVSDKDIRKVLIPLPPLHMQRRFAEIVDIAHGCATHKEIVTQASTTLTASLISCLLGSFV